MRRVSWMAALVAAAIPALSLGGAVQTPVPALDPQAKVGKLPNGFSYCIRRYPDPAGKVAFYLNVNAGTLHEDPDQLGLAHLLEHMSFNGTEHFPGDGMREYFNKSGLTPGSEWGAATGITTHYELLLSTNRAELYANGFVVMRDWAQGMTLDPEQIDKERGVVIAETRSNGDNAVRDASQEMAARLLASPFYPLDAKRKHDEHIRSFKHDSLRRFYRDWYRPDLETISVVGDIDPDQVEQKIVEVFSDLAMPEQPRSATGLVERFVVPLTGKNSYLTLQRTDLPAISVQLLMKRAASQEKSDIGTAYRRALLDELYQTMMLERMTQLGARYGAVHDTAYSIIQRNALRGPAGIDAIQTYVSFQHPEDMEASVRPVLTVLEQVRREGFQLAELARAKDAARKNIANSRVVSSSEMARACADYLTDGTPSLDAEAAKQLRMQLLEAISVDDVNDLVREWMRTDRDFDIVVMTPERDRRKLPSERQVRAWIEAAHASSVPAYVGATELPQQLMSSAEVARLPAGTVASTSSIEEIGAVRLVLGNGLTVLLKPYTDELAAGTVQMTGFRDGGYASVAPADRASARAGGRIVANGGVGAYDKFAVQRFSAAHALWAYPAMNEHTSVINAAAPTAEIEHLLQLTYLYFTAPRADATAFEDWKLSERRSLERQSGDERFRRAVDEVRFGSQDRDNFERADLDRAIGIYSERMSKAGDFTFVVSGDFNIAAITPILVKYLGALPPGHSVAEREQPTARAAQLQPVTQTIRAGNEDSVGITLYLSGRYTDTLMNRIQLEILRQAIDIRLFERLREQESATYNVGTTVELSRGTRTETEGTYSFTVMFAVAPDKVQVMLKAAQDELSRIAAEGLDAPLYQSATGRALEGRFLGRTTWHTWLVDQTMRGGDPTEILKRQAIIRDILTPEILNSAASKYIGSAVPMTFIRVRE